MVPISAWLANTCKALADADIESARLDAELLLTFALGKSREYLAAHSNEMIAGDTASDLIERRKNREPLAYIVGKKEFYGREFFVNSKVLIPRPETEEVISSVVSITTTHAGHGWRMLDVGTGSGCIAITLAKEIPNARVVACDISRDALVLARKNAQILDATVVFKTSNLLTTFDETFDIIVANLPYVDRAWHVSPETAYEPAQALFADRNGLELIERLIAQAPQSLTRNGYLVLELDPRQIDTIVAFAERHGLELYDSGRFVVTFRKARLRSPLL